MGEKSGCRNFVFEIISKKMLWVVGILFLFLVLTGCEAKEEKSDVSSDSEQEEMTEQENQDESDAGEDLSAQIRILEEKIDTMQKTLDDYTESMNYDGMEPGTSKATAEDISYEEFVTDKEMIILYDNHSDEIISDINVQVVFYDANDLILDTGNCYVSYLFPKFKSVGSVELPKDNNGNFIVFDHYELSIKISEYAFTMNDATKDITYTENVGADGSIMIQCTNAGKEQISEADFFVLYKKEGEVVGYGSNYVWDISPQATYVIEIGYPTDMNWSSIPYDEYEVYFSGAYRYEQ